jgi:hypothetical protein
MNGDSPPILPPEPKFDKLTEKRLRSLFKENFKHSHLNKPEIYETYANHEDFLDDETYFFIEQLRDCGESIAEFEQLNPPKQQKRRETIKSLGSAILRCVKQFEALDSGAKGFVFFQGMQEISKVTGESNPFPDDIRTNFFVHAHMDEVSERLIAFANGVIKAGAELPEDPAPSIELRMALWLEDIFFKYGFEFTTSQTSFAAECLRAMLSLGGINKDRVDYWLSEARKHPDSMKQFKERLQKTNEKSH